MWKQFLDSECSDVRNVGKLINKMDLLGHIVMFNQDWFLLVNAASNKPNPSPMVFQTDTIDSTTFSMTRRDSFLILSMLATCYLSLLNLLMPLLGNFDLAAEQRGFFSINSRFL